MNNSHSFPRAEGYGLKAQEKEQLLPSGCEAQILSPLNCPLDFVFLIPQDFRSLIMTLG